MQATIPQNWIEERNKKIIHAKAAAIGQIISLAEDLMNGSGLQPEAIQILKIRSLSGAEYLAVRSGIEKFLVGTGEEDTGFIGQILVTNDTEEFRVIVNAHGASQGAPADMEVTTDNILKYAKSWLARNAWMDLQSALRPLRSTAVGMHAAP